MRCLTIKILQKLVVGGLFAYIFFSFIVLIITHESLLGYFNSLETVIQIEIVFIGFNVVLPSIIVWSFFISLKIK